MSLSIQQAAVNLHLPHPIVVKDNGDVVSGRMDAHNLLGFQDPARAQQRIAVFFTPATTEDQILGFYPVFSDIDVDRPIFALESPITSMVRVED